MTKKWTKLKLPMEFDDILEKTYAIPHLPAENIREGVNIIQNDIDTACVLADRQTRNNLQKFATYLRTTWVPLSNVLSVYNNPIRTNNGSENFHFLATKKIGIRSQIWKMLGTCQF